MLILFFFKFPLTLVTYGRELPTLAADAIVDVQWSDGKKYRAKIMTSYWNDRYQVRLYQTLWLKGSLFFMILLTLLYNVRHKNILRLSLTMATAHKSSASLSRC